MSAELLRRAAKLVRERVEELPERIRDGIWEQDSSEIYAWPDHKWVAEALHDEGAMVAYYIELMHPPVALALADLLDRTAAVMKDVGVETPLAARVYAPDIAMARAILREEPS